MQFTGADILVIAIVLIVLAVYRQLDRSNRSLEKVKRYASRVHDELEAHVQEKVISIKDMGIELEVHQKAAREVLKRVQGIENSLNKRSEEIEKIGSRIDQYDSALEELVAMTARAQENMSRIRDESTYIDTVGRRIKQSQERMKGIEGGLENLAERFAAENHKRLKEAQLAAYEEVQAHAREITEDLSGFQERINQYSEYIRGVEERGESVSAKAREELDEILETVIHRAQEATIQSSEQIGELREQMEVLESDYQKRLLQLAERGEEMETTALSKLREQIEENITTTAGELSKRMDNHKRILLERVQRALTDAQEAQEKLTEREQQLEQSRERIEGRIVELDSELVRRIDSAADEIQTRVLGNLEERLTDYESQIAYRFEKLGDVGGEITQLEKRLQDALEKVAGKVQDDFTDFVAEFAKTRSDERERVQAEMSRVQEQMSDLESGLTDLKNQAYENVNAKLQVFEDQFFSDLRGRQVTMEQHVVDWQAQFQKDIDEIGSAGREERRKLESGYAEELKRRLSELQQSAYGRFEKFQEAVAEFQNGIELRVSDARELIAGLEREIEQEIQQLAADSKSGLREEFAHHREQVNAELGELRRGIQQQISDLDSEFTERRAGLESVLESGRSDAALWKAQVDQRLQTTTQEVNQQIADFRVYINTTISELRDAFAAGRDEATAANESERERLQSELDELSTQVLAITDDIRAKSEEALSEFGERYAELRTETERHTRALSSDVDARIKDFRGFVQDSREQFAAMQERLLGKLNEETQSLSATLQEIDKKQRSFAEQTRIFERADSLKADLEQSILGLRDDLDRVEEQRKEVKEVEGQFNRLRKSADEVTEKMSRFMAEKRRIDSLEDDYRKLMAMSQSVELKLNHVTGSNDTLQAMQASLRALEELEKDVESKFQRLEKKRAILDLTTEGVDKNFQELQEIESRLSTMSEDLSAVPGQIEELGTQIGRLAANKKDADAAMKQLALLDQTLESLEERMENLNQARDWLARTETRLGEVQRDAEEQVKLLGAILRQEGRGEGSQDGAPPVTTRDTVIKLARQSWNVDEIARATSLSRGEVELILELATK
jgi:chromosome segregation ATPase